MSYADTIRSIDPTIDADAVECSMRLQYGTLCHLDRATFVAEVELFRECERVDPDWAATVKRSYRGEG